MKEQAAVGNGRVAQKLQHTPPRPTGSPRRPKPAPAGQKPRQAAPPGDKGGGPPAPKESPAPPPPPGPPVAPIAAPDGAGAKLRPRLAQMAARITAGKQRISDAFARAQAKAGTDGDAAGKSLATALATRRDAVEGMFTARRGGAGVRGAHTQHGRAEGRRRRWPC